MIPALGAALAFTVVPSMSWAKPAGVTAAPINESARSIAPSAGTQAPSATSNDYASREASAKELETFEGGDTIVIGGSVLVIVLVVVLILVLI